MSEFPPDLIASFDAVHTETSGRVDALIEAYRKGIELGETDTSIIIEMVKALEKETATLKFTPRAAQLTLTYMLVEAVRKLAARPRLLDDGGMP